jgi:hypothetical protein
MPAPVDRWSDRLTRVDLAVDRVMATPVRITPMAVHDFGGAQPDPARPAFETEGVLTATRAETDLGGGASRVLASRITTHPTELQIMTAKLPPGCELRADDRVEALAFGDRYTISRLDRHHPGRIVLHLAQTGPRA